MMGWRVGALAAFLAAKFVFTLGCFGAAAQQPTAPALPCGGEEFARGAVSRVVDGRTFVLGDGREVRLAAIEVPGPLPSTQLLPPPQDAGSAPNGVAAITALAGVVGSAPVTLRRAEFVSDRYGRTVAYAYLTSDGAERLIQAELISAGFARVGGWVGSRSCAAELLRRETAARSAKLGLWADPYYEVLHADHPADVLAQRGRFALVEGKVVSVRESGATIYVNFGRRWSEDFAVTIRKRNERTFTAAGLDLKGLAGRRVLVRGWIEERGSGGSPWIEAAHPEQIEPADRD
jgi:endonuclease YncB( thermonuclease family)